MTVECRKVVDWDGLKDSWITFGERKWVIGWRRGHGGGLSWVDAWSFLMISHVGRLKRMTNIRSCCLGTLGQRQRVISLIYPEDAADDLLQMKKNLIKTWYLIIFGQSEWVTGCTGLGGGRTSRTSAPGGCGDRSVVGWIAMGTLGQIFLFAPPPIVCIWT